MTQKGLAIVFCVLTLLMLIELLIRVVFVFALAVSVLGWIVFIVVDDIGLLLKPIVNPRLWMKK